MTTSRNLSEDQEAAQALEAGGPCWRCERKPVTAVAVRREGKWVVQCINAARCRKRIREQLKAGKR